MRQGQQNRRGRGRNNNQNNNQQRKGQNPLTRSFESNGPDVKLRGTPAHIAEKYMSLARDAQSSGDPVLAENYLQHAEHYNRIIMAYREQQVSQGGADPGYNGSFSPQNRGEGFGGDMDGEEAFDGTGDAPPMPRQFGGEQPRLPDVGGERRYEDRPQRPHEQRYQHQGRERDRSYQGDRNGFRDRNDRNDRGDRPERQFDRNDRQDRHDRFDRQDRADRPDRNEPRMDRERPDRDRQDRPDRPERFERSPQPMAAEIRSAEPRSDARPEPRTEPPRRRERPATDRLPAEAHEQPEFLRRPVRRPRREDQDEAVVSAPAPAVAASEESE